MAKALDDRRGRFYRIARRPSSARHGHGGSRPGRPQRRLPGQRASRAVWIQMSVTDYPGLTAPLPPSRFDYVYHLAAYAAEGLSHFIRRYNYETNLIGSVNLINLAVLHKVKCFVFTSSIAVYGANQLPMTEDLLPQPEDPYGVSKYAVELDLARPIASSGWTTSSFGRTMSTASTKTSATNTGTSSASS